MREVAVSRLGSDPKLPTLLRQHDDLLAAGATPAADDGLLELHVHERVGILRPHAMMGARSPRDVAFAWMAWVPLVLLVGVVLVAAAAAFLAFATGGGRALEWVAAEDEVK